MSIKDRTFTPLIGRPVIEISLKVREVGPKGKMKEEIPRDKMAIIKSTLKVMLMVES